MSRSTNTMALKSCFSQRTTIILLLLCIILSSTRTVCFGWVVQQQQQRTTGRAASSSIPFFKAPSSCTTIKDDNSRRKSILSMQQQQQQRRLNTQCFSATTTTTSSSSDDIVTSSVTEKSTTSSTISNGATNSTTDTISSESTSTDNDKAISAVETEIKNSITVESAEVTKNDKTIETDIDDTDIDTDDDQYEYIEYDTVTENDYVGSEWLIGTNWNNNPSQIRETWVRLTVDSKSGKNIAIWGDNNKGTWNFDIASQFLSISKEYIIKGKDIWACTIDDYYYMSGTIRGWSYWQPASVLGQWQARRLNINKEEENPGTAPWFTKSTTTTTNSADDASSTD